METRPASRDEFRVAIICALLCEYDAVSLLFDNFYDLKRDHYGRARGDQNTYLTGRIGPVDAVLVRLSGMGKAIAASTTASLRSSFPRLELVVLTGICGGVPHAGANNGIVLGDVILAKTVVQYDLGSQYHNGFRTKTAVHEGLGRPSKAIGNFLSAIQSRPLMKSIMDDTVAFLQDLQEAAAAESWSSTYQYPGIEQDKLFEPTHLHKHQSDCEDCNNPDRFCDKALHQTCDELECGRHGQLVERPRLKKHHEEYGLTPLNPRVFFGCIGSGDRVIKSGQLRDNIAEKHELLAFEMEGAGVWDEIPCIIIKSVCDYADSHKNKKWQDYAAATAAAATKALLERYPRTDGTRFDQLLTGDNQVNACRAALSLREPVVDLETLKSKKGHRIKGTCKWIKDNEKYRSWLGGDSQFLWITGGPGKGKTMLSIFLTEELERHTQETKDAELLFYFCDHQDENRNSAVAVLRSLVCQLLTKRRHLMKSILKYFESDQKTQTTVSSAQALWVVFQTLLQADLGMVLCIIDGLDECDGESTSLLVGKFCDFFSPDKPNKMLKLVIVSRKLKGLEAFCQVNLDHDNEGHVSDDIANFISAKVEELDKVEDFGRIREQVETTLRNGANGTFLWVSLVIMELLKKTTCTEILDSFKEFPPGLDAIYSRMLRKMKKSPGLVASKILRWVVMALRPLTLSELAEAVQVKSLGSLSAEKVMSDYITSCEPMLKALKVGEEKVVVDLAHQSAREYLLRPMSGNDKPPEFHINMDEAHSELLGVCLDSIERSDLRHGILDTSNASVLQKSPLLDYATLFWPDHAMLSSIYADDHFELSRPLFEKRSALRENWLEAYCTKLIGRNQLPPVPSLLHVVCFLGIELLARKILSKNKLVAFARANRPDKNGNGPLIWAIHGEHETLVRLLLEKGAYIQATDKNENSMALSVASQRGFKVIVELLLEKSADINARESDGSTALMTAAMNRHDTVMELLLAKNADINAKNIHGRTALCMAAELGDEVIVKMLLEHKADVNAKDLCGKTALLIAAEFGEEAIVKILLEQKANVNAQDKHGNTALLIATFAANYTLMQLLLAHDADTNIKNEEDNTALLIASESGDVANMTLLLGHNACVHAKDEHYGTALIRAARAGHDTSVKLLLENGACINARGDYGCTALIDAAVKGHDTTVTLLLANGADVNVMDRVGYSALIYAAEYGHDSIVKLLLENGAYINAEDGFCRTALMEAALRGHDTTVKLLLAEGADVNVKTRRGYSALELAAQRGHESTVKLLKAVLPQSTGIS
ncbi:NACHT and Ankyrin domain protein [Metarhizium guizhouense ARSEF 977]|uniref:NACHT and Ankyrin domain protein n=1 Tax=Metarhizium guizhouense (strain ARSEF 977) TaxID=1276136 RepID=A0A0B4HZD3_METGA|nr:NACHT and Ankyrin domain protein [Metarhizium guizhouense ARSEF 977]